jgi:hypothetical protein
VLTSTQALLGRLADELLITKTQILTEAIPRYVAAVVAREAVMPEHGPVRGKKITVTLYPLPALRSQLGRIADDWGVTMGNILRASLEHYQAGIESGTIPKPEPTRKPRKVEVTKPAGPKKSSRITFTKAGSKPALVDRAECGTCHVLTGVDSSTSLLGDHIAHPSVRPKGEYVLCEGSGKKPVGPVIHSADIALNAKRNV